MQIYLTSTESKLRVRNGLFEVSYHDKEGRIQRVDHAPSMLDSIWLHDGAVVTIAALRLAIQNNIDVVVCDRHGDPEGRIMGLRPSTTSAVQKAQAMASISPLGLDYARGWVVRKLIDQAQYLEKLAGRRGSDARAALASPIRQINEALVAMQNLPILKDQPPDTAAISATLRGLEGTASKAFFQGLASVIPPQYRFEGRSRRPAKDIFNAYLNYAFAILYRKVERATIAAGLNSYIGFMHRDGYQFKSLVFDFIEPYRTDMVQAVFTLFAKQNIKRGIHTLETAEGAIRLTKEGKELLVGKINKFYEKKAEAEGLVMSRDRILEKDAQRFARSLVSAMLAAKTVGFAEDPEEMPALDEVAQVFEHVYIEN